MLKRVSALIVQIFDEREVINPDEKDESDKDADEAEEEDTEEEDDEEEGVNLYYDNPFSLIEDIKLSIDEKYRRLYRKITKRS